MLGGGDSYKLRGAAACAPAHVQVVADHVEEGFVSHEIPGLIDCVAVAPRLRLFLEVDAAMVVAENLAVWLAITRAHDQTHILGPGPASLVEKEGQHAARYALRAEEGLKGQPALTRAGQGDHGLTDLHCLGSGYFVQCT